MILLCVQKPVAAYIQAFSKLLSSSGKESWKDTFRKDFHKGKIMPCFKLFFLQRGWSKDLTIIISNIVNTFILEKWKKLI